MKVLNAELDFGYDKQPIALLDIMVNGENSVVDVAADWAIFDRQKAIAESIATEGLKNPVVVLADGNKYRFTASGARIQYAVMNGYTHIDAIVLEDETDIRPLMIQQAETEQLYLDTNHIHEWWKGT